MDCSLLLQTYIGFTLLFGKGGIRRSSKIGSQQFMQIIELKRQYHELQMVLQSR